MGGYVRRIAAIRQIKGGFSASGAPLSGLIKVEKYGGFFTAECSLIGFAPLDEGKYICAVTDGRVTEIFDCPDCERQSNIDITDGFAAIICFARGSVEAIASATSGDMGFALLSLKSAVERAESSQPKTAPEDNAADNEYSDEAIAEENYYEFERAEDGGDDRKAEKEAPRGNSSKKNENDSGTGGEKQTDFYKKIEDEVKRILSEFPKETALCEAVEGSDWVKIDYGGGASYVFGVIYDGAKVRYLCYGVPAEGDQPPESLKKFALHIPTDNGGYFVCCQSAATGKSVKIK